MEVRPVTCFSQAAASCALQGMTQKLSSMSHV
jgi:hypothetical protein